MEEDKGSATEEDARKRILRDRRRRPTPMLSRYTLRGRRRSIRRQGDRKRHIYVDQYGVPVFILLIAILVLGSADALLTLYHVSVNEAVEMNPVMNFFLGISSKVFFNVKFILTLLCLLVLCLHKNLLVVKYILAAVLILYLIIVLNHIYMFFKMA